MGFDTERWAQTQPHTFYSHWPRATMTKCDYCGVYSKDHPRDVLPEHDAAKDPRNVVKGGLPVALWPFRDAR